MMLKHNTKKCLKNFTKENDMSEYKKIVDERFHGGEAEVKIENGSVHVLSSAGFQLLAVSELPKDLLEKIQEGTTDELTTLGEIGAQYDRIYEVHRLIKNAYKDGTSFQKLHPLAQELADLTRMFVARENNDG